MIPVYETERFRREANRCALSGFADELRRRFERDPDPSVHFDSSLPQRTWYTIKRRKGHVVGRMRTVRLVRNEQHVEQEVFCLIRVIGFDEPDRNYIIGRQARERVKDLPEGLDEPSLRDFVATWLDERETATEGAPSTLPPLPDGYRRWLDPPEWIPAGELDPLDLVVYETREWRNCMPGIVDHWAAIHEALVPFLYDDVQAVGVPEFPGFFEVCTKRKAVILCLYRAYTGSQRRRLLMLIDARDENQPGDLPLRSAWTREKIGHLLSSHSDTASVDSPHLDHLGRRAIRAYPGFYLDAVAYEAWKVIEEDESANLAMSPEEESLLAGLTRASGGEGTMPAFINGRAGSGKSTVLYYLFAHYWMYGKRPGAELPGSPLFLTLSGRLLSAARRTVESIIDADCRYLPQSRGNSVVKAGLEQAFRPFRSILLDFLPPSRRHRYCQDREIDFEVFRRLILCEDSPRYDRDARFMRRLNRSCTPELCWHVIRSYVKGFSPRGLMDAGSYRALPKMDLSVEHEHFEWVCEKVWPWYRGLTTDGDVYWDQQDLAREVLAGLDAGTLQQPDGLRECVAVFCDEAQDLTGVELCIVLRLSLLARHDLAGVRPLTSIPFAFAGDPLQTLNPSGFRWDNLTSSFYRNLQEPLGLRRNLAKSELNFNYRSPRLIAKLANLVQFHRRVVFHDNYLKPQQPWGLEDGMPPTRYRIPETLTESEMEGLQDSFVLLPCADGHESEFVERYPVLQQLQRRPNPPELISVMAAKGLDLKKVVVFAFGDSLFPEGVPVPGASEFEQTSHIGLAYAFNQLYVAVTRSTDELLLMDTADGNRLLWDQLFDQERIEHESEQMDYDTATAWREVLPEGPLPLWDSSVQFAPLTPDVLREQADSLRTSGRELRRVDLMERAAAFYKRAGRHEEEKSCRAYALWFAGNHSEAAKLFQEIKAPREAAECLWEGMAWADLATMGELVTPIRLSLARFMAAGEAPRVQSLHALLDDLDRMSGAPQAPTVPQWREVAVAVVHAAAEAMKPPGLSSLSGGLGIRLARLLKDLGGLGHLGCSELAADCYAGIGDWRSSREVLNELGHSAKVNRRDEIIAHTAVWPEYVRPCHRGRLLDLCLERWQADGRPVHGLSREEAVFLFDTLWGHSERREAVRLAFASELLRKLWEVRGDLSLAEQLKTIGLCISKDRSAMPVEDMLEAVWGQRSELSADERLELVDALCAVGQWERVANVVQEILELSPRPVDLSWICDAVAVRPPVGKLPDPVFDARGRVGEMILLIARRLGVDWPLSEVDLQRAAAALDCIGLDKHLSALGRMYGDAASEGIRNLSRRIYMHGRALYHERLERSGPPADRKDAERETGDQLDRWGIAGGPKRQESFYAPPRVALPDRQCPILPCGTPVAETDSVWYTESQGYCIEVQKAPGGNPIGTVEVRCRQGRRPKTLFIDTMTCEVELSDGRPPVTLSPGESVDDRDIKARAQLRSAEGHVLVTVYLPPWPDGVRVALPATNK